MLQFYFSLDDYLIRCYHNNNYDNYNNKYNYYLSNCISQPTQKLSHESEKLKFVQYGYIRNVELMHMCCSQHLRI